MEYKPTMFQDEMRIIVSSNQGELTYDKQYDTIYLDADISYGMVIRMFTLLKRTKNRNSLDINIED